MEHFLNAVIGSTAEFFQNSEVEFIDVDQEGDKAWTSSPSSTDSPKPPDSPRAALTSWIPLATLFSSSSSSKRDELEPIVEEKSCVEAKGRDGVCTQEQQPSQQSAPRAAVVELQPGVRQYHYGPLKYDYDSPEDTGQKKSGERKERRMSFQKPKGMMEYTAGAQDTLNSIALKFDTTPNELVQLNKLFSRMIVPGQMLYCPDPDYMSSEGSSPSVSPVSPLSPTSSEAEFEKLQDTEPATQRPSERPAPATSSANPARSARVVSSTSEEEEALSERFLKINCKYITNGKGVVGGVLLVTPNNIMFDPHKLDPLVVENGCEEYGIICPMDEVISAAMYHDIVNTKIKDVTPMPEEWVNLALGKKTSCIRPHGEERESRLVETGNDSASTAPKSTEESLSEEVFTESELSPIREEVASSDELEQSSRSAEGLANSGSDKTLTASEPPELCAVSAQDEARTTGDSGFVTSHSQDAGDASLGGRELNSTESQGSSSDTTTQTTCHEVSIEADGDGWKPCDHLDGSEKAKDERASAEPEAGAEASAESEPNALVEKEPEKVNEGAKGVVGQTEELEELRKMWKSHTLQHTREQRDNIQHADVFSSEKRVKKAVMFLCLRVGKPMMKTFVSHAQASMQQYAQKDTEPEYWFAVPQERADHLFAFFVQWSPELYGVEGDEPSKEPGFVVVEKSEESDMIDDVYDEASGKEWEVVSVSEYHRRIDELNSGELRNLCKRLKIVTADEAKRQHGPVASTTDLGPEAWKPVLNSSSSILEQDHINKLAANLPPRTVGYPWTLAYSTSKHGMSLKTLYRTMVGLDSPMLLVIKDTDRQIFGALSSDPFKVSDHFYGTGETFLFTFNPEYQCYKWTGDNLFFIKGDMDSLAIGGGSGQFGLWLDEDLYHGRSHFCKTFNNETLSKKEDFFIQEVEVWLFE